MEKIYVVLLLIYSKIAFGVEYPIEKIESFIVETYYNRNSVDIVAKSEEYKNKFNLFEKQTGLTHEQVICSTIVIIRNKEPDSSKWAEKLLVVSAYDEFTALLYALCVNGYTPVIRTMQELLHGVNGEKRCAPFAASTLFNSPVLWYPIAKYIIDSGTVSLRCMLYGSYLRRYVYEQMKNTQQIDSLVDLVCYGLMDEFEPNNLQCADELLVLIEGYGYSHSNERFYYLNKKLKSNEMKENVLKQNYLKTSIKKYQSKILKELGEIDSLHSSGKFKILFKIKEDLDTVKLNWELFY